MNNISTKTIARIAVVQALYQYQINGSTQKLEELILGITAYYKDSEIAEDLDIKAHGDPKIKLNITYFSVLLQYTLDHLPKIDEIIEGYLSNPWRLDTLHASLLALLRAAIAELLYFPEVPYRVVINEFTDIASDMLKDNEVAFVNSLLDNVRKKFRPDE